MRALRVARHLGDLPRVSLAYTALVSLWRFFCRRLISSGDVQHRIIHKAQLFDLAFQFGNGLLEIEKKWTCVTSVDFQNQAILQEAFGVCHETVVRIVAKWRKSACHQHLP